MLHFTARQIGERVRLRDHETEKDRVLEGVLEELDLAHREDVWRRARIGDEWVYITDWDRYDVIERDGKTVPDVEGVYRILSDDLVESERLVQRDNEGQWWPYPYSFSGWRTAELLTFAGLEPEPELEPDYPEIKDPEERERFLNDLRVKSSAWEAGYEAARSGEQRFTNPYSVCSICEEIGGKHNKPKHDKYFSE